MTMHHNRPTQEDVFNEIRRRRLPCGTIQVPGHRQYVVTPAGEFVKIWGWRNGERVVDHNGRVQFSTSDIVENNKIIGDKNKRVSRSAEKIIFKCFSDNTTVRKRFIEEFINLTT